MAQDKTSNRRIYDKFEYHLSDCSCVACLYWKDHKLGCSLPVCCCEDIKNDARAHGRIKRKRGAMQWDG